MLSQRRLRDELRFVTEFQQLFDVMQQVSVAQLKRVEDQVRQQASAVGWLRRQVLPALPPAAHATRWLRPQGTQRVLVVLTSDEGMVGPLHGLVAREALARMLPATHWLLVGQRGRKLLGATAARAEVMPAPTEATAAADLRRLAQALRTYYLQHEAVQDMWLIAARHISATRQTVQAYPLLPLPAAEAPQWRDERPYVIEPSLDQALMALADFWLEAVLIEAYWSARRAELAARALHVEASRQELQRYRARVRHEFFKTAHERVDRMVRETCIVQRHAGRVR